MPIFNIDIIDLAIKGIIIGILASAPMGPVGVLCVQRTMKKGRWYGFVTGVGAAFSDIIYAMITGLGMSFVMDLITSHENKFYLQVIGGIILLIFGIWCFRSDPTKNIHASNKNKGTLLQNGITGFLITISNPLIVFLFMACFAQFAFVVPSHPLEMSFGFLCIFTGAVLWWWGLTWLIDKVREKFSNDGIIIINRIIGGVVSAVSIIMLIGTIFNLYTFSLY